MAIDPAKMDAFLNEGAPPPTDEDGMLDEGAAAPEESNPREGHVERFSRLIPLLEEHIDDVNDAIDEVDPDVLLDTESKLELDDYDILVDAIGGLDKRLQKEMKASLSGGVTLDEADYVAEHLQIEGHTDEPEKLAGWLFRAAESYAGAPEEEDEEEDEDLEEEDEDLEDEDIPAPEDLIDEV